ncbi:MAG TPA: trehalose-6-phosphate synthase [Patescibacteria group bacterium]
MKNFLKKMFNLPQRSGLITIIIVIVAIVSLISIFFAFNQVNQEQIRLVSDIQYRSSLLADSLKESVEPNFINKSDIYLQSVVDRFADKQRIAGLAIVDNTGKVVAITSSLPKKSTQTQQIVTDVMDSDTANGDFINLDGKNMYVFATPLHDKKSVVGALVIDQNASYINNRLFDIWTNTFLRLLVQTLLISIAIVLVLQWIILKPIQSFVTSLKEVRLNKNQNQPTSLTTHPIFGPIFKEVSSMQQSLIQARLAASEEAKMSLEKLDSPWTEERLKQFTKDLLKDRKIIAVSNLEPYIHTKSGNEISYHVPASGLVTAIEPVMQACGGMWVAQGIGDADKMVVDSKDTIQVPPEEPKYTLKRVWLTGEEVEGYYYGFSDRSLYPLFHMAHTRPVFNANEWEMYKNVNEKFAKIILSEIKYLKKPVVFIQDFQFTLLPKLIKDKRPDATIGLFWHIPWVSPESFSICPWKKEIVDGMLGADLIGFHTQQHCNNFISTVGKELEALIDYEQFAVTRGNHTSIVKPFPVSIPYVNGDKKEEIPTRESYETKEVLKHLGIKAKYIGLGVDRMDYIKGVLDRLISIEIFLDTYPTYKEQFTFIQISSPSEGKTSKYLEFVKIVEEEVERINGKFKTKNWKPILLIEKHHSHKQLKQFYKLADFCLITSLHDGMNLVAKEFVASRSDEKGVLILSQFAGAAKELKDALIINPYNGSETALAINNALKMSQSEQTKRMKKMRSVVKNYNIYRWSAEFIKTMISLG